MQVHTGDLVGDFLFLTDENTQKLGKYLTLINFVSNSPCESAS
jgi:hypothetical protein